MRGSRTTRLAIVAITVAALAGMAGCTPSEADAPNADDGAERVYIEAISADPDSFNAQLVTSPTTLRFSMAMMETLVGIDDEFEISPVLAESYDLSDDGLTLTLELQDGVTWHDGEPFTAADVVFNLEEIVPLQSYGTALADRIASVEAPDDHTVVVTLTEQFGPLFETLSQQLILPRHIYEGTDYVTNPANMAPIGTGPMKFESFSSGESVILVKNEDWWQGETQIDRAVYPIMTDVNTRTLALIAGELDMATVDPAQQEQVAGNPDLTQLERGYFPQAVVLQMNTLSPYLGDPEVRKLIFSAIDREEITDVAVGGLGTPATGFFPDELAWAVNPDIDFDADFAADTDAINAGLDDAGFPVQDDGFRFTLDVRYITTLDDTVKTAELMKAQLAEVGINVNLLGVASPVFTEKVYKEGAFDLSLLRTTVGPDPSMGISRWYECNADKVPARNPSGVCDAEIDAAALGAMTVSDRDTRAEHFSTMQERARDLMFFAPLVWTNGSFPTVNTSRWEGLTEPKEAASSNINWLSMNWIG